MKKDDCACAPGLTVPHLPLHIVAKLFFNTSAIHKTKHLH